MSWKKLFNLPSTPEMDTSGITTETAFGNDYESILRQKMLTGWSSPEEKAAALRFKEMSIDKSYQQDMGDIAVNLAGRGMTNSGANTALMERAMLKRSQAKEQATQGIADEEKQRQYETMGMAGSYATNKLNAIQTAEMQKRNAIYQNALMRFQKKMFAWQTGANIIGTGLGMWAGGAFGGGRGAGSGVGGMKFFGGSAPPTGQNYSPNY